MQTQRDKLATLNNDFASSLVDSFDRYGSWTPKQAYWVELRELLPIWDGLIDDFNRETGAAASG